MIEVAGATPKEELEVVLLRANDYQRRVARGLFHALEELTVSWSLLQPPAIWGGEGIDDYEVVFMWMWPPLRPWPHRSLSTYVGRSSFWYSVSEDGDTHSTEDTTEVPEPFWTAVRALFKPRVIDRSRGGAS